MRIKEKIIKFKIQNLKTPHELARFCCNHT